MPIREGVSKLQPKLSGDRSICLLEILQMQECGRHPAAPNGTLRFRREHCCHGCHGCSVRRADSAGAPNAAHGERGILYDRPRHPEQETNRAVARPCMPIVSREAPRGPLPHSHRRPVAQAGLQSRSCSWKRYTGRACILQPACHNPHPPYPPHKTAPIIATPPPF